MRTLRLFPGLITTVALFFIAIAFGRWRIDYGPDGEWTDPDTGQVYDTAGRLGYTLGAVAFTIVAAITIVVTVRRKSEALQRGDSAPPG